VATPVGNEVGVMTIAETEEGLAGHVVHMGNPQMILEKLSFEDGTFTFELKAPALIRGVVAVEGDAFEGTVENVDEGIADIPFSGTRKTM